MNIVFLGSSLFGLRCLEKVLKISGIEVVGIITVPEVFKISYRPEGVKNVLYADFYPIAKEHNIPIITMEGKMSDAVIVDTIKKWNPQFMLAIGWYHMVPRKIRDIVPTACIHASLLPKYSGGAPLVWAIINNEKKTGITFFLMNDGVDSGPIIGQEEEEIRFDDTIKTLYTRIENKGLFLLEKYLPMISDKTITYTTQDETKRQIMPQRSPKDGLIDFNRSSLDIYNFVRALTKPYPGAFYYNENGEKITVWKIDIVFDESRLQPGDIVLGSIDYKIRLMDWEVEPVQSNQKKSVYNE